MTNIVIVVFSVNKANLKDFINFFTIRDDFKIILVDNTQDNKYKSLELNISYIKGSNRNLDIGGYLEGLSLSETKAKSFIFVNDMIFRKHSICILKWFLLYSARGSKKFKVQGLINKQLNTNYLNTSLIIVDEEVVKYYLLNHSKLNIAEYRSIYKKFGFLSKNWELTGATMNNSIRYKKIRMVSLEKYISLIILKPFVINSPFPLRLSRFMAKISNYATKNFTLQPIFKLW